MQTQGGLLPSDNSLLEEAARFPGVSPLLVIPLGGLDASSSSFGALEASAGGRRSKPRFSEDGCGVEDYTPLSSSAGLPALNNDSKFQSKVGQSLGPVDSRCQPLRMMLQYSNLLDCSRSDANDPLGKEMVIRVEKLESSKALGFGCGSMGEEHNLDNLPSMFVNFNNFVGMPVVGFEKEINSLLRKMEARKGSKVKISRGKRKTLLASHLEKEI